MIGFEFDVCEYGGYRFRVKWCSVFGVWNEL